MQQFNFMVCAVVVGMLLVKGFSALAKDIAPGLLGAIVWGIKQFTPPVSERKPVAPIGSRGFKWAVGAVLALGVPLCAVLIAR